MKVLALSPLSLLAGFFICLSISGCGGAAAAVEGGDVLDEPRAALDADALLPSDCFVVVKLDLIRLRESSNWDLIESWLVVAEENLSDRLPSLGDGELRRWLSLTDRIWVGFSPSQNPREPDVFAVVTGRFDTAELSAKVVGLGGDTPMFRARPEAPSPTFEAPELGDVVILDEGLAAMATSGRISEVVMRHDSREGQSPLAGADMAAIAQRVNFARDAVGVAAVFTPEAKAALRPNLDPRARRVLDVATTGAARVGVGEGLDALAIVTTTDATVAAGAVAEVQRQRDAIRRQPIVTLMGLSALLDGIGVEADGGDLRLSLRATHEDTRNLMGRASGFIGIALSAMLADFVPRPAAPVVSE